MKTSLIATRAVVLLALAAAPLVTLAGCGGNVVVDGGSGTTAASGTGGAPLGTSSSGAAPGTGGAPVIVPPGTTSGTGGMPALCTKPATPVIPYNDPVDFYSMFIGQWLRCGGTIQPAGSPPAPDGQDGLQFDNQFEVWGLLPGSLPLPPGGTGVLPYVGGLYEPVEWKLVITPTGLNVSFTGTTIGPVSDVPVFTDGANTMSLSDPLWAGTYVRYPP